MKLFEPMNIGRITIKNRAVMPPMQVLAGRLDGTPGERIIKYYEERAKGGTGLIIIEATAIDDINNKPWDHQLILTNNGVRADFLRLTEAIHKYDAKVFIQLHHYGSKSAPTAAGPGWTSSEIPAAPGGAPGHAMTVEEIKIVEQRFIDAAVRAKQCGFDGVELAGTHGYLLTQFISPYYNNRTDEYGGSTENRLRIYTEIVQGIHKACGPAYPVSVRFPGDEFSHDVPGTLTIEDGVEIAKILEAAGADVLNVSNGNNFNADANCEPYFYDAGWKKHIAKAVKDAVSIPVMATNTIKTPEFAEQMLQEEVSDFVCLGRALIADPEFMNKAKRGDSIMIRKCMGCMHCRENLYAQLPIKCTLNPRAVNEDIYPAELEKDGIGRKVVVIGGGPAGMEAALVLAQRHFSVTLFEKEDKLGGTLNLADKGFHKEKITLAVETMAEEIKRAGVEIRLGTEATAEAIEELKPVGVVVAMGADDIVPPIKGIDAANVVNAHDLISGEVKVSGKVAVIGAGMTGLEAAEMLAEEGCEVSIVEMQDAIGVGIFPVVLAGTKKRLAEYNINYFLGHALAEIDGKTVKMKKDGEEVAIDADYVVLALGVKPNAAKINAITEKFENVLIVGDAEKGGKMPDAIRSAYIKSLVFLK